MEINELLIRRATAADAQGISDCVSDAYQHYVSRIGRPPAPMLEDYRAVVDTHEVFVGEFGRRIIGVLVLAETSEGFLLHNVAVDPKHQGRGIGRKLLALAETRAIEAGYDSIYLYTNQAMAENLKLYVKVGYEEFARRREKGMSRVYMRKRLP